MYKEEDVTNECHSFPPFPYTSQLDHYSNVTKDDVSNPAAAAWGVRLMLPGFFIHFSCVEKRDQQRRYDGIEPGVEDHFSSLAAH